MQKRTREIIALVLLIVLGIAGVSAMAWYILVGHNWNEAASNIDDHIGAMNGYTVVLCKGTTPYAVLADELADEPSEDAAADEVSTPNPVRAPGEADAGSPDNSDAPNGADADAATGDTEEQPVTLEQAVASYVEKDAQVITVDISNPNFYEDPIIVERNGKRIAVFYVSGPRSDLAARQTIKQLAPYDIDVNICIIDELEAVTRGLGHTNIALCTDVKAYRQNGYIGRTYTVGLPAAGQIRAVLLAPSGFVSSKVLESL